MLQMAGVLEVQAAKLRRDALSMLLGTISDTATTNLWKLLEHFFGVAEDPEETEAAEASSLANLLKAQREEREHDRATTAEVIFQCKQQQEADSTPTSSQQPMEQPTGAAKCKKTLKEKKTIKSDDDYPNKCSLAEAQLYFPTCQDTMHQTGVADSWIGERIKLGGYKGCYPCQGENCDYVAQTRGVLCSHVRRVHLGIAIGCRLCPEKCWWQARTWAEHMDKSHADLPRYEVVTSGANVVSTTEDEAKDEGGELYISEETIIVPAPGTASIKQEAPEPPSDHDEPEEPADQVPKQRKLSEENKEALGAGAQCIRADPAIPKGSGAPLPKITGICYKKQQPEDEDQAAAWVYLYKSVQNTVHSIKKYLTTRVFPLKTLINPDQDCLIPSH